MCQCNNIKATEPVTPVAHIYATPFTLPDANVLIRRLDPYQMACLALDGVFSDKVLKNDATMTYLRVRTSHDDWLDAMGTYCEHTARYRAWIERLKAMNPLHYYWLSQAGFLRPLFCPSPGSDLAKWVAATVLPPYLPSSFYFDNRIHPAVAFQGLVPPHREDLDFWRKLFEDLHDEFVEVTGERDGVDVEDESATEVMSGSE